MKVTDQFPGDFIDTLCIAKDADTVLTIASVHEANSESCADGRLIDKPLLGFKGTERKLILNKTNAKTIGLLYGNEMTEWIGKKIALYIATEDAFGQKDVVVVRVRPFDPESGRRINIFAKRNKKS